MTWQITFNGTKRVLTAKQRAKEIEEAAKEERPAPSVWESGSGVVVSCDDLDLSDMVALADELDVRWQLIYDTALYDNIPNFMRVVDLCAKQAGLDPPSPAKMREFMEIYRDGWEFAPSIDDRPFVGGFPQTPGEPENGSTSTSPGDTDGLQTSLSGSPSEGS